LNTKRDECLDYAKGIGILLVIWNHSGNNFLSPAISRFHLPLFFIISGIICSSHNHCDRSLKEYFHYKSRKLLLPYFGFGILDLIVYSVVSPDFLVGEGNIWIQLLYFIIGKRRIDLYFFPGALWFLIALFSCEIVFFVLKKLCSDFTVLWGMLLVICYGVHLIHTLDNIKTFPMNLDLVPFIIPFFAFGFYFSELGYYEKFKGMKASPLNLIICFGTLWYVSRTGQIDIWSRNTGDLSLFFVGGVSGSLLILEMCKMLSKIASRKHIALRGLSYCGINSLYFMAIHQQIIIHPLNSFKLFYESNLTNFCIRFCLSTIVTSMFTWFIIYIRRKYFEKGKNSIN